MDKNQRETVYSSKSAAIRGMWRYFDSHVRCDVGRPLIGDEGTVLQWCDNGYTNWMSVTHNDRYEYILVKSWVE